ncbi:hypothetical protein [Gallaecimonas pentaromativorans]
MKKRQFVWLGFGTHYTKPGIGKGGQYHIDIALRPGFGKGIF